jgi:hypothetical protein
MGEFDKINDSLNTNFDEVAATKAVDTAVTKVEEIKTKKDELVEKVQTMVTSKEQKYTLEDKEYIKFELQSLIENNKQVMMNLQNELKIGAPPRIYETFAILSNSTAGIIKELLALNRQITNYQVIESEQKDKKELTLKEIEVKALTGNSQQANSITNVSNNVLMLDYNQMSKILQEAKSKSALNKIDAKFDLRGK